MEKAKSLQGLEGSERVKAIVERFGDKDSFLMKSNPEMQCSFSDRERAVFGEYPTVKDVNLAYGKDVAKYWLYSHVADLAIYTGADNMTKNQIAELASVIATECQDLKVSEILHFFYCLKSGRLRAASENKSPMSVIVNLRSFLSERNALIWRRETDLVRQFFLNMKKVYLIAGDQPKTKVYARVFRKKEKAEKALEERDNITGERLYPNCHIIERTIE